MLWSTALEVAIGLVFVYLLLSLVCSAAKEGLEAVLKKRARNLEQGIKELLEDHAGTGLAQEVYNHPLINGLFRGQFNPQQKGIRTKLPSYIPSQNFALALVDVVLRQAPDPAAGRKALDPATTDLQPLRDAINRLGNAQVKQALLVLVDRAGTDINRALANIEAWFDSAMDRVAGWYKRWSQMVIFLLGLLLVILLNADTIAIGNHLLGDPSVRQSTVAAAQEWVKNHPQAAGKDESKGFGDAVDQVRDKVGQLGLPIGWDVNDASDWPGKDAGAWVLKALGLLLTALAISLGASFWFDVLNRFMVVRSTVKPKEKSPEEKSKDK